MPSCLLGRVKSEDAEVKCVCELVLEVPRERVKWEEEREEESGVIDRGRNPAVQPLPPLSYPMELMACYAVLQCCTFGTWPGFSLSDFSVT
jgi:hypothetical protein